VVLARTQKSRFDSKVGSKVCADEVSDGNEGSTGNQTIHNPYYTISNMLTTFCPCLKTLWDADFKGDGLVYLVGEILRQQSIHEVV
jgi:hypothetical protein